jgi:hypothetical protein
MYTLNTAAARGSGKMNSGGKDDKRHDKAEVID